MKTGISWKHPGVLLGVAGVVAVLGGFALSITGDEKPEQADAALSVESNPWAKERFKPGASGEVAAAASASPSIQPASAASPVGRTAKLVLMMQSADPAERMNAASQLFECAEAQLKTAGLVNSIPAEAAQLNAAVNKLCDGLQADIIARRFEVIEELAKDRHPGAAVMFIATAPDGTDVSVASKDPNYGPWYQKALGYLESAARDGHLESITAARNHITRQPERAHDALVYRIAELEGIRAANPHLMSAAQVAQMIERESQTLGKSLSSADVKKAVVEGRAMAKIINQRKGT